MYGTPGYLHKLQYRGYDEDGVYLVQAWYRSTYEHIIQVREVVSVSLQGEPRSTAFRRKVSAVWPRDWLWSRYLVRVRAERAINKMHCSELEQEKGEPHRLTGTSDAAELFSFFASVHTTGSSTS